MKTLIQLTTLATWLTLPGAASAFFWSNAPWTEEKLEQTLQHTDEAARAQHWPRAIKHGERALEGCQTLRGASDPRCIAIMRKNSTYYYLSDRHPRHARDIEIAYQLALAELGPDHYSTRTIRDIHYRVLLHQKRFHQAIPVLQAMLQAEQAATNEPFKILDLTLQLYGLYHLTKQPAQEEAILKTLLPMVADRLGDWSEDYQAVARALAENYCAQKKYHEFFTFAREYQLDLRCKPR